MPTNLSGIIFNQVYTDNTGGPGAEYDSDGDGVATQEDEFVGILNNSGSSVDISGWQIWSDSAGSGAPDTPVDGLYHTFAAGTIIGAGAHLTVINEISTGGSVPYSAIEASEGGVESGAGGVSTNLLTEGNGGTTTESIVLVNPATGEYIVFNFGPDPFDESTISGFPGTISLGEVDAEAVSADPGTGFAVQYDSGTDSYILDTVFVPCFTPGTRLSVPSGTQKVEELKVGDLVTTHDGGSTVVRATIRIDLDLTASHNSQHKPIIFKEDCFGKGCPERSLMVSPQHRVLMEDNLGNSVLVPAKALTDRPGIRIARGRRSVTYIQIICTDHSVIEAENLWTESFLPGPYSFSNSDDKSRQILTEIFPELVEGKFPNSPHRILKVSEAKRQKLKPPRQNRSDHLKRVTAA